MDLLSDIALFIISVLFRVKLKAHDLLGSFLEVLAGCLCALNAVVL